MENVNDENQREIDLILRIKQGDRLAFTDIINKYQKKIFGLALGFFHDRDDAMEIVQETFIRVYEKLNRFTENTHFRNWIYRISMNLCVDYYRKFKKNNKHNDELYSFLKQNSDCLNSPEDHMASIRLKEVFKKGISTLPKRQKLILVMKHYGQFKYREIADILNVSTGCVKSLHHRAIQKLKKVLIDLEVK